MWDDYFTHPEATLLALDIRPKDTACVPRFKTFVGDQADPGVLKQLSRYEYDVIVDDGGHRPTPQKKSHQALWPRVKPGGLYIIEDINQSGNIAVLNKWKDTTPIWEYLFGITKKIIMAPDRKFKRKPKEAQRYVDEIHFYRHLVIMKKAK